MLTSSWKCWVPRKAGQAWIRTRQLDDGVRSSAIASRFTRVWLTNESTCFPDARWLLCIGRGRNAKFDVLFLSSWVLSHESCKVRNDVWSLLFFIFHVFQALVKCWAHHRCSINMYWLTKYFIMVSLKLLNKKPSSHKHEGPSQILSTHLKEKQDTLMRTCDPRFWEVETAGLLGAICQ